MERYDIKQLNEYLWEMPRQGEMLVPARIYGDQDIINNLRADIDRGKEWNALKQLYNVASLPGVEQYALAMSDVHPGYGFPIGGVAAFDLTRGVISVAGVGFDINCGVRALKTPLKLKDLSAPTIEKLAEELYRDIPAGVGSQGEIKLNIDEIDEVLTDGAAYVVRSGYGLKEDLDFTEERGRVSGALAENVSPKAKARQFKQIGTLGSGNHYLELQYVETIYDQAAADAFGLFVDQLTVFIHCGSRGLGHQIGTDYLPLLAAAAKKYNIPIRERELVCAPIGSSEGKKYFSAVNCGINCAFANRQVLTHLTRLVLERCLGLKAGQIRVLYDIGHNTVKLERHLVQGRDKELLVHRKGSTRAFGPGRIEVSEPYRRVGQPVLIGGTMGTHSYILHGSEQGMKESWGSACHGAGRAMSRIQAKKKWRGQELAEKLKQQGIVVKGRSWSGLAEEAPGSYKDVDQVVRVMHNAGIALKVAKLRPLIVIKG